MFSDECEMVHLKLEALMPECAHCRTLWRGHDPSTEAVALDWEYIPATDEFVHGECADAYRARLEDRPRQKPEERRATFLE